MIIEALPLWHFQTNCYIVADKPGGKAILVDLPGEPGVVAARLNELELTPAAILHTHGHIDHVSGSGEFSRMHGGIPAYIHDLDRSRLLDPRSELGVIARLLGNLDVDPPEEILSADEGELIELGEITIEPIHTPGHTPGHLCYLLRGVELSGSSEDLLFSGDHLFAGSVGRTDLPGGSWETLMTSMREKILPLDDRTIVAPGHGPLTTIGQERRTNPFLVEAERQV